MLGKKADSCLSFFESLSAGSERVADGGSEVLGVLLTSAGVEEGKKTNVGRMKVRGSRTAGPPPPQ
jgi:hypothetical protein